MNKNKVTEFIKAASIGTVIGAVCVSAIFIVQGLRIGYWRAI